MRHKQKKIRFRKGRDATRATARKLVLNFIEHGKIETTVTRARTLKSLIDRLVYKAQNKTESNKNVLLSKLGEPKAVVKMFDVIGPHFKNRTGGYVRLVKLGTRLGDGGQIVRVEWIKPIVEAESEKVKDRSKTKAKAKSTSKKSKVESKEASNS